MSIWLRQHFNQKEGVFVKALEELQSDETQQQFEELVERFTQSHSLNEELQPFLFFLVSLFLLLFDIVMNIHQSPSEYESDFFAYKNDSYVT